MVAVRFPASFHRLSACLLSALLFSAMPAHAVKSAPLPDHWVGTWATSPFAAGNKPDSGFGTADMTYRQIVHTTLAGPLVRVEFTNQFGTEPLTIGAAHIALAGQDGSLKLPTANALTFGGQTSITIPPGAVVVSDPAGLNLPTFSDVAISIFLPAQKISTLSYHGSAFEDGFSAAGNVVGQKTLTGAKTFHSWYFLKDVQVQVPGNQAAVVTFGDSITDGAGATNNLNDRYPDVLARRLAGDKKTRGLAVLNEGIGGNRILADGTGPSALARFDNDVLALPGVKYLVILEGINDIGRVAKPDPEGDMLTADLLIQGLAELAERAHTHGITVIGATLTPYGGAKYFSPKGEQIRQAYNTWIRTSKLIDGVVDFDKATRDPNKPDTFRENVQRGDYLHPNPAGYRIMGDAFDLNLFDPNHKTKTEIHSGN